MDTHRDLTLPAESTAVVVIDVQERPVAALGEAARSALLESVERLVHGAKLFELPVIIAEQNPDGLGPTVGSLLASLDGSDAPVRRLSTLYFDATRDAGFDRLVDELIAGPEGPTTLRHLVVCGLEAHLGVYQTVRGLVSSGYHVHVPLDATACRNPVERETARGLLELAGGILTSTETVLFDLLGHADDPRFKAVHELVRRS